MESARPKMMRTDPETEQFLKAALVLLFVSVNELCVHVQKESSMWNDIQHSQIHLSSWKLAQPSMRRTDSEAEQLLKATLVLLFVSVNALCVHVPNESSMWNDIRHSQIHLGP